MPWNDPLLPQSAIDPAQQYLEQPKLDQSPWMARLKGFGSGALEGLRNLTKPSELAGIASLAIPGMGEAALGSRLGGAAGGLARAVPAMSDLSSITPEVVEAAQGVKQVLPNMMEGADMMGAMKYNLAKLPSGARAMPGATDMMSEVGKITPEAAIAGGAAGAGGLYLANKARQAIQGLNQNAPSANPFQKATNALQQR